MFFQWGSWGRRDHIQRSDDSQDTDRDVSRPGPVECGQQLRILSDSENRHEPGVSEAMNIQQVLIVIRYVIISSLLVQDG